VIATVVGALVVLGTLSALIKNGKPLDGSQREVTTLSKSSINTAQAVESFRNKLMALPESDKIISSIQAGQVEGVLRLQVTNVWFDLRPHEKRQLTQMIAKLWQSEIGDGPTIVHIYDFTGREIAGTKAFGGVWVENE
jgi:protein tyrosine phosphatase